MEGFWGILKRECYYGKRFTSKNELVQMIKHYICYYKHQESTAQPGLSLTPMEKHAIFLAA